MTTLTREIQFVYPQKTHTVSLSGGGCALDCKHCNKHYIKQMKTLKSDIPEGTKSLLISGGLKKNGESFILDKKKELIRLKAKGGYKFNSHVGFVDPKEIKEIAGLIDYVSFDFVSDPEVIKRVYKLDKSVEEYIEQFKMLREHVKVYPHVTIGLDGGKIHWEKEAIDILANLGADRLVLNVLIPTPGTEFADVKPPNLEEVEDVLKYARKAFEGRILIVGCMRPLGKYRLEFDEMAVREGVDRIVQPTPRARRLAEDMGLKVVYFNQCCALDGDTQKNRQEFKPASRVVTNFGALV
jgi:uncharacterized radical SAM superfamily protein